MPNEMKMDIGYGHLKIAKTKKGRLVVSSNPRKSS